jgi:hypothetical protein
MKVEKLARRMDAWRYGYDRLPVDVEHWVIPLGVRAMAVLISPRAGTAHGPGSKAGTVLEMGWWIVRAETGCLYAVSDDDFRKKYRITEDQEPPASAPATLRICWPASAPRPIIIH